MEVKLEQDNSEKLSDLNKKILEVKKKIQLLGMKQKLCICRFQRLHLKSHFVLVETGLDGS